jgi:hypothetical protein
MEMKVQTIWNIRDARGLSSSEKLFLFTVASRGISKVTRKRLIADTGLSTGTISNVVESLEAKGLVTVYPGYWKDGKRTPTHYVINNDALSAWVCSMTEQGSSTIEQGSSMIERGRSMVEQGSSKEDDKGNNKVTNKGTDKENNKKAPAAGAAEPDDATSLDSLDSGEAALEDDPVSPSPQDDVPLPLDNKETGTVCSMVEHTQTDIDYDALAAAEGVQISYYAHRNKFNYAPKRAYEAALRYYGRTPA